jgi:hypothetical protein
MRKLTSPLVPLDTRRSGRRLAGHAARPFSSFLVLASFAPACVISDTEDEPRAESKDGDDPTLPSSPDFNGQSHPLLADAANAAEAGAPRFAGMLSRTDAAGFGWTIEEGAADNGDGRVERFSGLARVKKTKASPERLEHLGRSKVGGRFLKRSDIVETPKQPAQKIDPSLLAPVDAHDGTPDDADAQLVLIRIAKPDKPSISQQLNELILDGTIESADEFQEWEELLLAERVADVAAAQIPVREFIESIGGTVSHEYTSLFGIDALLTHDMILATAALPNVEVLDANHDVVESADGVDVLGGSQIQQFIDGGFDGEYGTDAHVAVIEINRLDDEHLGFNEAAAGTRIASRWECDGVVCSSIANFPATNELHPVAVAGIILGDLRDAQDPAVVVPLDRAKRSGYAGEARLHMYRTLNGTAGLRNALDHVISVTPKPRLVNMSVGATLDDQACAGESALSGDANDVFEAGALIIQSAGNNGHANANDCTVLSPGSAIGVFTVAGHGNSTAETIVSVRSGAINSLSSQGGSVAQGKGRSIIDLTAYACRTLLFDGSLGYTLSGCGVSYSAPTVTATAVDFSHFYKTFNAGSTFIDDPGVMFVELLLFGDRQGLLGKVSSGFDPLWGAGRLKARKGDGPGMDTPYLWKVGSTCVDAAEEVVIPVNSGSLLSADVDDLKAVVYWYDYQHFQGIQIDDIDLLLEHTDNSVIVQSTGTDDNKERVYTPTAGNNAWQLRIVGADVTSDSAGCGANSMLVYWSYFYEDDDRDDGDGPSSTVAAPE